MHEAENPHSNQHMRAMAKKDKKSHTASLLTGLHKSDMQYFIPFKPRHYLAVNAYISVII